jgi:tetratricopeptide (TPR) repeat protein
VWTGAALLLKSDCVDKFGIAGNPFAPQKRSKGLKFRSMADLFISYSHKDSALRKELEKSLRRLEQQNAISTWYDRQIGAGEEWRTDIDRHLESARVILLLISEHFLASGYCMNIEMRAAMERHDNGLAAVVPIYLSKCDWHNTPFSELTALPSGNKPVTRWVPRARAFAVIVESLGEVIAQWRRTPRRRSRVRSSARASVYYARGIKRLKHLMDQNAMFASTTRRMEGEATGAIRDFDRAIAIEPAGEHWLTWDYYNRGLAHFCRKDLNAAIADFSRAINIAPDNAFAYRQRAIAFDTVGDYQRALQDYRRAIRTAPSVAKAYFNRGALYWKLGKLQKAKADFKKALKVGGDPEVEREARKQLNSIDRA